MEISLLSPTAYTWTICNLWLTWNENVDYIRWLMLLWIIIFVQYQAIENRFLLNIYITLANKASVIFARNHGKFQYFQINISYFGYWQIVMQRKWLTFSLPVVYLWYYPSMFVYDNLFVTRTKDFDTYIATL